MVLSSFGSFRFFVCLVVVVVVVSLSSTLGLLHALLIRPFFVDRLGLGLALAADWSDIGALLALC